MSLVELQRIHFKRDYLNVPMALTFLLYTLMVSMGLRT